MSGSAALAAVSSDQANPQFYPSHEGCIRFVDHNIPILDNESYRGSVKSAGTGYEYLPLHTFIAYYTVWKGPYMGDMQHDVRNIISSLDDYQAFEASRAFPESLLSDQLKRIERALHRLFPILRNNPINKTVVTDKVIQKLFPALIPDSPFTTSEKLNRSLLALPLQITEFFLRTIVDGIASLALSAYAFKDADMAEYLKARLSITHNNSLRAIWENIYINL
jgi:hypothetical protein